MADKKPYLLIKRNIADDLEKHLDAIMTEMDWLKEIEDAMYTFSAMWASAEINKEEIIVLENWAKRVKKSFTEFYLKYKKECSNIIMK